jgi:hypothetical protein
MTEEEILPALVAVNERRCRPPLDHSEVVQITRNVCRYPAGRIELSSEPSEEWPDPIPFVKFDVPAIPPAALPGFLGDMVAATSQATETPFLAYQYRRRRSPKK